jgi:hypothetical protein
MIVTLLARTAHSGYSPKVSNDAYAIKYRCSMLAASGCSIHIHTIYHCGVLSLKFELWLRLHLTVCECELRKR